MTRRWLVVLALIVWLAIECLGAMTGNGDPLHEPFENTDQNWIRTYQEDTGWRIYHLSNTNPYEPEYRGECTWFVYAARSDELPTKGKGNAEAWYRILRNAGYGVAESPPKPGAIAVWDENVAGGHGHVAIVTKVLNNGCFEVWDSNWGPESRDHIYTNGRVRRRLVDPRVGSNKHITGYVYWSEGHMEPPPEYEPKRIPISPGLKTGAVATCIVMDCSNSMVMPPSKMERAKQAACSFIEHARGWDAVSLAEFAHNGRLLKPLTSLSDPGGRRALKEETGQITPDDWTNIGAGLEVAYTQLINAPKGRFRSIVLLTDGCNNKGAFWPAVNKCKDAGIPIFTVAYGTDADYHTLMRIARLTGGMAFLAGTSNLTKVYQRIAAMCKNASVLVSYSDRINQGDRYVYPVLIPDDIRRAWFGTDWGGSKVEMKLISPSGTEITPATRDPQIRYAQGDTYCLYVTEEPETGEWQVRIYGAEIPETEQVNLTVSGESPLMANCFQITPYLRRWEPVNILARVAEVLEGKTALPRELRVTAMIAKPSPQLIEKAGPGRFRIDLGKVLTALIEREDDIELFDDGRHGDLEPNDGIYGANYKDTDRDGPSPQLMILVDGTSLEDDQHLGCIAGFLV